MLEFKITVEEANLIISALSELPVKVSLGLIDKLQKQATEQLKSQKEATEEKPVKQTSKKNG